MGKLNGCPRNAHMRPEIGHTLMLCQSRSAKKSTSCLKSFRKVRLDRELFSAPGVKHSIRLSWCWPTLSAKSTKHWQKNSQRINRPGGCRCGMYMATILVIKIDWFFALVWGISTQSRPSRSLVWWPANSLECALSFSQHSLMAMVILQLHCGYNSLFTVHTSYNFKQLRFQQWKRGNVFQGTAPRLD